MSEPILTDNPKRLIDNERHFLMHILAFFANSDGIVNENIAIRFYNDVKIAEARCFYGFQIAMENIHNETYSIMIDTFAKDPDEKHRLFNAVNNFPSIKALAEWATKWILNDTEPFYRRLVAFGSFEGIVFSGPFCGIFWFKKSGLLSGLCFANELISRDEGLHTDFAALLYNHLTNKPETLDGIIDIIVEAVNLSKQFIIESLPCKLIGINDVEMSEYIEFIADRFIVSLGYNKYYNTKNPFPWMDMISAPNKTNFFERRVADYSHESIMKTMFKEDNDNKDSKL